jgi:predicted nucleotidyltransferase
MSEDRVQWKRKAYSISFSSFLLQRLGDASEINRIILYGSVAKGTSTAESDVDIFIDVEKNAKKLEEKISGILEEFYKSKEAIIFKLAGIENEIKIKTGALDEWDELKRSMMSEGFVLWGRFEAGRIAKTEHKVIFYWSGIGKNRGAFLNKIYGYRTKDRLHEGFLSRAGGERLGKSCIIIPIKYRDNFVELIKKYNVEAKVMEVFV